MAQHLSGICIRISSVLHFLNISASSKGLFTSGDNNSTNAVILVELSKEIVEFVNKRIAKSVKSLGSVQGDETNLVSLFVDEVLVLGTGLFCEISKGKEGLQVEEKALYKKGLKAGLEREMRVLYESICVESKILNLLKYYLYS